MEIQAAHCPALGVQQRCVRGGRGAGRGDGGQRIDVGEDRLGAHPSPASRCPPRPWRSVRRHNARGRWPADAAAAAASACRRGACPARGRHVPDPGRVQIRGVMIARTPGISRARARCRCARRSPCATGCAPSRRRAGRAGSGRRSSGPRRAAAPGLPCANRLADGEFLVGQQRRIEWCVHRERIFPDSPERRFARYPSRYSESRQPAPAVRSALFVSGRRWHYDFAEWAAYQERRHRSHPGARAPDVAADPAAPTPAWQVADRPSRPRSVTPETTRSRHASHEIRSHRLARVAALPRHDDLRAPVRRSPKPRDHGPRPKAASTSSTRPTSIRSAATGPQPAAPRRSSATGSRASAHQSSWRPNASARWGRSPGQGMSRKHILDAIELAPPPRNRLHRSLPVAWLRPA